MEITIPYKFQPRSYQLPLLKAIDEGKTRAVCVWHRRSGKDKTLLNLMIKKMCERVGSYYYFFPTYAQGKKILWNGIDRDGFKFLSHFPKELIARKDSSDMLIELRNGSVFQVIGTDNINSIVGTNPVGCVFSEYSLQDPQAWDFIRPILRENGGWAIFNFTPRGKNHAYELLEIAKKNDWFHQILTINDTQKPSGEPVISKTMIQQELDEGMDPDLVQQEYYCSFNAALQGSYYGKQLREMEDSNRFSRGLYDPNIDVETWWDLGIGDSTAILFTQSINREIRFVDYYESSGHGLEHYIKLVREKPYIYKAHHAPHDIEVRELGTGKSRKELASSLGINFEVVPKLSLEDGIQAVRSILNRVWIDTEKCQRVIDALQSYSKEWDDKNKLWRQKPKHDWTSHCADAVRYFAVGYREQVPLYRPHIKVEYNKFGQPVMR